MRLTITTLKTMSAFTSSNLPSSIDTLEKLAAWVGSALAQLNKDKTIQTTSGSVEQAASIQTFTFKNQQVSPARLVVTLFLPLTEDFASGGKLFSRIGALSENALPASYTSN